MSKWKEIKVVYEPITSIWHYRYEDLRFWGREGRKLERERERRKNGKRGLGLGLGNWDARVGGIGVAGCFLWLNLPYFFYFFIIFYHILFYVEEEICIGIYRLLVS